MNEEAGFYGQIGGVFGYYGVHVDDKGNRSIATGVGVQASVVVSASANAGIQISLDYSLKDTNLNPFRPC